MTHSVKASCSLAWRLVLVWPLLLGCAPPSPSKELGLAIAENDVEQMRIAIASGARIDTHLATGSDPRSDWCLPIHMVAANGNADGLRLLLEKGADPNSLDAMGNTPLMDIVVSERTGTHQRCIDLLIEYHAEIDAQREGDLATALHLASRHENIELFECLVRRGADTSLKDAMGRLPLKP